MINTWGILEDWAAFVELAIEINSLLFLGLPLTEGIGWKTEDDGQSPRCMDLNFIKLIWGKMENKWIYCRFKGKPSVLEKVWENICV